MTREFEKMVAKKISIYQATLKMANNGLMPKTKADLVTGLLFYLINNIIDGIEDIPLKYREILEA